MEVEAGPGVGSVMAALDDDNGNGARGREVELLLCAAEASAFEEEAGLALLGACTSEGVCRLLLRLVAAWEVMEAEDAEKGQASALVD